MYLYRVSGLSVGSEIVLPGLIARAADGLAPDVTIRRAAVPTALDNDSMSGPTWQIADRRFLLRIPDVARFLLARQPVRLVGHLRSPKGVETAPLRAACRSPGNERAVNFLPLGGRGGAYSCSWGEASDGGVEPPLEEARRRRLRSAAKARSAEGPWPRFSWLRTMQT